MKRIVLGLVAAAAISVGTPAVAHARYGYRAGIYVGGPFRPYYGVYRPYYGPAYYPPAYYPAPVYPAPVYPVPVYPGVGVGVYTPGFSFGFGR